MPDFVDAAVAGPVPVGYEPSPFLPESVQAAVRAEHAAVAAAEASVGTDGSVEVGGGSGFEHKLPEEPLTWVDVPESAVEAWLGEYFEGRLASHKTTEPIGESTTAAAARVASQPRFA